MLILFAKEIRKAAFYCSLGLVQSQISKLLSVQFFISHFGISITTAFCHLVPHPFLVKRERQWASLLQRGWWNCMYLQRGWRTPPEVQKDLGCSQPNLSDYFPTWFSQFWRCIAPLCCDLMSEILKKRRKQGMETLFSLAFGGIKDQEWECLSGSWHGLFI